jgi:hypothetical protein
LNLNGIWRYGIAAIGSCAVRSFGEILVPYPYESVLSGVADTLSPNDILWYTRNISVPAAWLRDNTSAGVLLHACADWHARVFVDGRLAGAHSGGYDAFTLDLTDALHAAAAARAARRGVLRVSPADSETLTFRLSVAVWDPSDRGVQPHGKQSLFPTGIWCGADSCIRFCCCRPDQRR